VSERGWVSIENAIDISRSPEDVFDYLTDIGKELEWNPRTRRVEKLFKGREPTKRRAQDRKATAHGGCLTEGPPLSELRNRLRETPF
jgi:hypothetical protein